MTVGDNNYGRADQIDQRIGKYFHEFIGDYRGSFGNGSSSNRFFPALGNHGYFNPGGYSAHLNYFTLPGNERYYELARGPAHLFVINSEVNEPNGTASNSVQALWLSNRLAASTAPWKLLFAHDPPYSSSTHAAVRMRWPFEAWGASAIFSGSAHHYERISRNGLPYFVNGAGGAARAGFDAPAPGSVVRYGAGHGAMLVTAETNQITFEFYSVAGGGTRIDRLQFTANPRLAIRRAGAEATISWETNTQPGFQLEETTRLDSSNDWAVVSQTPIIMDGTRTVTLTVSSPSRFFRLRKP